MATHICRDFLSRNIGGSQNDLSAEGNAIYFLTIFMMGTLGWSVVAETDSDFAAPPGAGADFGSSNILVGSSSMLVSCGSGGSLNLGSGFEYRFEPPSGSHRFDVLSSADASGSCFDTGRILVLRSDTNPAINSGLFRITKTHPATGGLNLDQTCDGNFASGVLGPGQGCVWSGSFSIDFRSSQFPPAESGSLTWYVYQHESELGASDPSPPSLSAGGAVIDKLVLQSPSSSWQLRLAQEPGSTDGPGGASPARVSMAPGFGADSNADFPIMGDHLHGPRWFDSNVPELAGGVVGLEFVDDTYVASGSTTNTGSIRAYMWGSDDVSIDDPGAVVVIWRNAPNPPNAMNTTWRAFGFCESESSPLPPKTVQRMFAMGGSSYDDFHRTSLKWVTTQSRNTGGGSFVDSGNSIVGFGLDNRPALGNVSTWCFLNGQGTNTLITPRSLEQGTGNFPTTSSFTREFELLPVDVVVGTWDTRATLSSDATTEKSALYTFNGRQLGRFPIARYGVASRHVDLDDWAITDDTLWIHTEDGIYLPWSGTL